MKVKTISRSTDEFTRERSNDLQRVFRNYDPNLRPQEKAVEYVRALNAAKLEKIFGRPFVGAMEHNEAISCMAKNPNHLKGIFVGSEDGDIRLWDITSRRTVRKFPGHRGAVRGLTATTDGSRLVSCGADCIIRRWTVPVEDSSEDSVKPEDFHISKNAYWGVDHQWKGDQFATVGAQVDIWNHTSNAPVRSFQWGTDTVLSVRFNPGHPDLLATSASDRSITLYDVKTTIPIKKLIMQTKTNSIAWNPMEPMNFTAANEDGNCYSYDLRKLNEATMVHTDHAAAVMDIDYSPTGREFVTGSYDRTVRIFRYNGGHSREIYHTSRMQRVFCVKFSCDASYVISGSDDYNLRLWKAMASEQLGVLLPREKKRHEYDEALKNRYKHLPEVKRILRHRHLPLPIYKAAALRRTMTEAARKKEERRKAHSAPGSISMKPLRKRRIVKEVE
ncbi:DDB1- and CUL4-associated factor 13 [Quercus lobata]|uniref:DDB1- and CUL4-associated factor 13 n=1 Tax=Quercus lobata TaxID=97700 RepID=UPI001245097D|nr:DDB1- and CUL4-associated factor 13 [Quercus lobata]